MRKMKKKGERDGEEGEGRGGGKGWEKEYKGKEKKEDGEGKKEGESVVIFMVFVTVILQQMNVFVITLERCFNMDGAATAVIHLSTLSYAWDLRLVVCLLLVSGEQLLHRAHHPRDCPGEAQRRGNV